MNSYDIAHLDRTTLQKTYAKLIVDKMHIDKWFSDFLAKNTLDHDELNTPEWAIYKKRIAEYSNLSHTIKQCEYQLGKKS